MEFITAVSPEFYNPEYFNMLEQFEYDQMYSDASYMMLEAYEATPLYEADNGTVTTGKQKEEKAPKIATKGGLFLNRIKEFFKKVIDLIKKVIRKFVDKSDEYFKINEYFLKNQASMLTTVNKNSFWNNCNLSMYDYDFDAIGKPVYASLDVPKIDAKSHKLKQIISFNGTEDELKQKFFNQITRLQTDGVGFKEAAKLYFRGVRSNQAKPIVFKGNAAKDRCMKLLQFAQTYKDSCAKKIRDSLSDLEGSMTRVGSDMEKSNWRDYVLAESTLPTLEADDTPKNGTVGMIGARGNSVVSTDSKNKVGTEVFDRVRQYGDILITVHTAQMTVAEELYFCAIHILKKIYNLARNQGLINVEKAGKNEAKRYNQEKDKEDMSRTAREIQSTYKRGKSESDAISKYGSA